VDRRALGGSDSEDAGEHAVQAHAVARKIDRIGAVAGSGYLNIAIGVTPVFIRTGDGCQGRQQQQRRSRETSSHRIPPGSPVSDFRFRRHEAEAGMCEGITLHNNVPVVLNVGPSYTATH